MTTQSPEILRYQGETLDMHTEPLNVHLVSIGLKLGPFIKSSDLWRGYIGTWEIRDDRLYLLDIDSVLKDDTPVTLKTIFPNESGPVFASWYSGTLKISKGEFLEFCGSVYNPIREQDMFFEVNAGVVANIRTVTNTATGEAPPSFELD